MFSQSLRQSSNALLTFYVVYFKSEQQCHLKNLRITASRIIRQGCTYFPEWPLSYMGAVGVDGSGWSPDPDRDPHHSTPPTTSFHFCLLVRFGHMPSRLTPGSLLPPPAYAVVAVSRILEANDWQLQACGGGSSALHAKAAKTSAHLCQWASVSFLWLSWWPLHWHVVFLYKTHAQISKLMY